MDILLELLGRDWDERRAGNAAAALALGNGTGNALELKALADAFHGGAVAVGRAVTPVARLLPLGGSAPALGTASDPTVTPDAEFDAQATLRAPGETLVPVIERLATAADRPRILAALEHRPDLIWVVLTHGWEREARPLVTRRLGNHPAEATEAVYLNPGWLEAAVRLRDPQTFEDLKWWLIYGWGKANTYALLRRVPDLNLNAPTVTAAWRRVVAEAGGLAQALEIPNRDEAPRFAALAARRGNRDALGFLFRVLRGWRGQDNVNAEELRFALVRLTQARGADADMLRWYSTNRGRLVFDRTTRQFSVRAGD
jgi:hypothetical protein